MGTTLTPKNLADLFKNITDQYDAVKTAQDTVYGLLRGYNLDFFSHLSSKSNPDIQVPIVDACTDYQRSIRDMEFTYSSMYAYSQYRTLFSSLDTYFRSETALTDKTLNGFLAYNKSYVSDKENKVYNGIMNRFLQARNVLVDNNKLIYKVTYTSGSFVVATDSPSSTTFNNTSYASTLTDGITYAPFPMKIYPASETSGFSLTITFSDNTTTTLNCMSTPLTTDGEYLGLKSGIKSIAVASGSVTEGMTFSVYSKYAKLTFSQPTGWECYNNLDNAIQCYVLTSETQPIAEGTRVYIGCNYYFPLEEATTVWLYLRINPSLVGDLDGKFTVGATELDYGTQSGSWYVNNYEVTLNTDLTVTANVADIGAPIAYVFSDAVDFDLSNPNNYIPMGTPTAQDTVIVSANFASMTITGTVTCDTITFGDGNTVNATINGDAVFNGAINQGTVNGTATFNASSNNYGGVTTGIFTNSDNNGTATTATFNDSNNFGTIGTATFNGTSVNVEGDVTVLATFNDTSSNESILTGTAIFNDSATNAAAGQIPSATFNETSANNGALTNLSYFYGSSIHVGTCGDVEFHDTSTCGETATVTGSAYFYDSSVSDHATLGTAWFYDSSTSDSGQITDAHYLESSTCSYTVLSNAEFKDTSTFGGGFISSGGNFYATALASSGQIFNGYFYPVNTGTVEAPVWTYPTVNGGVDITNASVYWIEGDAPFGGNAQNLTYMGYP